MKAARDKVTETGGREATTRPIPPKLGLAVGMPSGHAPIGWQWSPLTKLARLESGHTPSRKHSEYWGGNVPWISIQDARNNHGNRIQSTLETTNDLGIANSSSRILPENTVCLSRTASVGYVVVMGKPMATSQDFINWVCSSSLEPEFLKWLFVAEDENLLRFASGAVHQTIYFPEAKAFHICHPPLPEQQRIVSILDRAFEGIAKATANAGKNLSNARELFESYRQLLLTSKSEEWSAKPFGEVCGFVRGPFGGSLKKSIFVADGFAIYEQQHAIYNQFDDIRYFIDEQKFREMKRFELLPNDLIMSCSGTMGCVAIVPEGIKRGVINQALLKLTPKPTLNSSFLKFWMESRAFQDALKQYSAGAAIQNVASVKVLKEVEVPLPPISEQKNIVTQLSDLSSETEHLAAIYQQKLSALSELKKSILHQAFTGQLH